MEQAIAVRNGSTAVMQHSVNADLYSRFIASLDAKDKTVKTYTTSLRQFFAWLSFKGIVNPQFEDIKAYRDEMAATHKPTTVQAYIFAVRRFFDWTESEGLYPNVAGKIKGAKLNREPKKDYLTSEQAKAVLAGMERETLQGKGVVSLPPELYPHGPSLLGKWHRLLCFVLCFLVAFSLFHEDSHL